MVFAFLGKAQNLVQNGSFEEYTQCPDSYGQIDRSIGWSCPNFSTFTIPPDEGTMSEYYHQCASNSSVNVPDNPSGGGAAQSGDAYVGFYGLTPYDTSDNKCKEYLQGTLVAPLKSNIYYCYEMYIKRASFGFWAINDISVYFSNALINDSGSLDLSYLEPQITNVAETYFSNNNLWAKYTGYFKADGGEKYLIIGGFLPVSQTPTINTTGQGPAAYYFIDKVQLYECGDSLNTGLTENPFTQTNLYPNPTTGIAYIDKPATEACVVAVYDAQGRLVFSQSYGKGVNRAEVNLSGQAPGLYFCRVVFAGGRMESGRLVVTQ